MLIETSRASRRMRASLAPLVAALVATALAALSACAPTTTATRHAVSVPAAAPRASAAAIRLGPVDPAQAVALSFPLARRAPGELMALLAEIADPRSPRYHHYLTSSQYEAMYGPDAALEARAVVALRALGFTVTPAAPGSDLLQATGTAASAETAFGVRLYDERAANGTHYMAPDGAPRLPAALAGVVSGVIGLDTRPAFHPAASAVARLARGVAVSGGGLDPSALRQVYDVAPLTQKGLNGAGQTIAVAEIDRYSQADVALYDAAFALSPPDPQVIVVGAQPASVSPEPALDIEILNAIAPKAQILVYESKADFRSLAQMFDRIVSDNRAQIASVSLGACEAGLTSADSGFIDAINTTFQRAVAQGMSTLVASGDAGAYGCQDNHLSVDLPGSSPYVTSVGGTALFPAASGGYGREDGWEGPLESAGGGGGLSVFFQQPSWQSGPGVDNTYSDGMRQTPDVAADADPLTGYRIYYTDNSCSGSDCWTVVGGTSAAAPFWAGLIALANQQGNRKLGFLNPALYAIGAASDSGGPAAFHDISGGGNLYYLATSGWDYSTGWGSPDAAVLIPALLAR
ncbi:MAG TPA: S53 family peptidase [Ktedonobacterales bacterium]